MRIFAAVVMIILVSILLISQRGEARVCVQFASSFEDQQYCDFNIFINGFNKFFKGWDIGGDNMVFLVVIAGCHAHSRVEASLFPHLGGRGMMIYSSPLKWKKREEIFQEARFAAMVISLTIAEYHKSLSFLRKTNINH